MKEGALVGSGGNAPLAPRLVPLPFAAEEEEGGSRSSRSPCSRAARSGLEIMPILYALLCCAVSGLRLFRKRCMCESFAPCQAGQADGNSTQPRRGESGPSTPARDVCLDGFGKQSKIKMKQCNAMRGNLYRGRNNTCRGDPLFPLRSAGSRKWRNGAMAGSLSLFPATFIGLPEVSQRWSVGTIFIAYLRNTLLSGWGYCSFWGAKLGVLYLRQQFDLTLAGPPPK